MARTIGMTQGTPSTVPMFARLKLQIPTTVTPTAAIRPILMIVRLAGGAVRPLPRRWLSRHLGTVRRGRLYQRDRDPPADGPHIGDGEVDLAEQQDKRFRHRQDHEHGALREEVYEVPRRQEYVVWADRLEDNDDEDETGDNRQHPALPAPESCHPGAEVLAQGL